MHDTKTKKYVCHRYQHAEKLWQLFKVATRVYDDKAVLQQVCCISASEKFARHC